MNTDQTFIIFGHLVRQARLDRGLSQQQLAQMLQTRQATVSEIEHGKANPRMDMILRVIDLLHLPEPWKDPANGDPYADMVIPEDAEPDPAPTLPEPV